MGTPTKAKNLPEINRHQLRYNKPMLKWTIVFILFAMGSEAQVLADFSLTTGRNYVSFGQYAKFGGQFFYKHKGWNFSAGAGVVFSQEREKKLDALRLSVSKDFTIKELLFNTQLFYQRSPFSARLNDQAAGVLFNHNRRRWHFYLGANTRVFSLTNKYKAGTGYEENALWEPVNVMYRLTWHKPVGKKLEINTSVTNFDQFLIEQETNPFLMTDFRYRVSEKSKIYFDAIYQQAGFFNIRVNYFGYYLRAGYTVDIGGTSGNSVKLKAIEW